MLERDRWDYGSAPWFRVSGTNQRFDVSEGCVAAGTTGISEMFLAVLEPYAGKLARTVLRGPRFRKGAWLPSNDIWGCLLAKEAVNLIVVSTTKRTRPNRYWTTNCGR